MKVRVLKRFKDKETGAIRVAGDEFECSKERYKQICEKNSSLVEVISEEPEGEAPDGNPEGEPEEETPDGNPEGEPEEETSEGDPEGEPGEEAPEGDPEGEPEEETPEDNPKGDGLAGYSKKELQEMAKNKGIKGVSTMNRLELMDALSQEG